MKKTVIILSTAAALFLLPILSVFSPRSAPTATSPPSYVAPPTASPVPTASQTPLAPSPSPSPTPQPLPKPTVTYMIETLVALNVRTAPDLSSSVVATTDAGDLLPLEKSENGFYKTTYLGKDAYVSAREAYSRIIELPLASEKIEEVLARAYTLLGTPYVYGAARLHDGNGNLNSAFYKGAFDCSSLTQYVFYYSGVMLATTTRTQVYQGTEIAYKDVARGDLLFFTNATRYYNSGIERIGHVAIYLGNGYILHTSSDYAVIEKLSATRISYFITARRML